MSQGLAKIWNRYLQCDGAREFVRFCLVGVLATAIHYGIYYLLNLIVGDERQIWTNINYTTGYLVSWLCNLWLTALFTFKKDVTVSKGIGFAVCHLINYGLHLLFLNLFLSLGMPRNLAPIPVYAIVIPINFILVRTVFKRFRT